MLTSPKRNKFEKEALKKEAAMDRESKKDREAFRTGVVNIIM